MGHGGFYFLVLTSGYDQLVGKSQESGDNWDNYRYEIGNYFKTEEQAQAAAEALKAMLAYIHDPETTAEKYINLTAKILDARNAVQKAKQ
jgi:hypothetical protein